VASIADVFVTVLPETSKIADGIKRAMLSVDDDVRKAAKRWKREIDRELKDAEVEVDADTTKAKKEIQAVEKGRYTAKVDVDVDQASLVKATWSAGCCAVRRASRRTPAPPSALTG
jgi:hypothetical protein